MSETPCPFCGQIHGTACNATIPDNPTDQIAAVPAYDWGYDDSDGTDETCFVLGRKTDRGFEILAQVYGDGGKHLAAYIERLEAERDALLVERMRNGYWALRISTTTQRG